MNVAVKVALRERAATLKAGGFDRRTAILRAFELCFPQGLLGLYETSHQRTGRGSRVMRHFAKAGFMDETYIVYITPPPIENIVFFSVNANDITGNMAVKIDNINGIDAETAGKTGYIQTSILP